MMRAHWMGPSFGSVVTLLSARRTPQSAVFRSLMFRSDMTHPEGTRH